MWIDTHIHLDDERYRESLPQLLEEGRAAGIAHWIIPATDEGNFEEVATIAREEPDCSAAFGLHPYFMERHTERAFKALVERLELGSAVAIGECGLDFAIPHAQKEQEALFYRHIELAEEYDLPLIIHGRKSYDQILKALRRAPKVRGVCHSFIGSEQQADQLLELGFYLGFGGAATYERAKKLARIIKKMPLNRLLLETDAPFQPSSNTERGVLYRPIGLLDVATKIAQLREISLSLLSEVTSENAQLLFSLSNKPMT